ncbi:hypothetical protein B5181_35835, partial [Streptomyces sp. 4F]
MLGPGAWAQGGGDGAAGGARLQRDAYTVVDTGASGLVVQARDARGRDREARAGVRDLARGGRIPFGVYYRIGSDTKTFVAVAALQLVADGKLSLDDTIDKWLPGVVKGNGNDGSRVTVETRRGDLARLTPDALAGAGLVTASALLDVLTAEEVGALAAACATAGCPALLTLSVAGRVELTPAHPLDAGITEAFNEHQRRTGMLGPDAVTTTAEAFAAHGATVRAHPSPWRLGPGEAALADQWLRGWVGAAVEQRPELREPAGR